MKLRTGSRQLALELVLLFGLGAGPLTSFLLPSAWADAAGDAVMARAADQRRFQNTVQTLSVTATDARGSSHTYRLELRVRQEGGERRTYIRVLSPASRQGHQYLWIERPGQEIERYRHVPGQEQVQRVPPSPSADTVLETDLLFTDFVPLRPEEATHHVLEEETLTLEGRRIPVQVVESVPKDRRASRYTRMLSYVGNDGALHRVRYYRGEREVRRQTVLALEERGLLRLPTRWLIESPPRGSRTELKLELYHLNVPTAELPDRFFTPEYLRERGRAAEGPRTSRG